MGGVLPAGRRNSHRRSRAVRPTHSRRRRAREGSAYDSRDVTDTLLANLQPRPVRFYLTSDGIGPQVDQRVAFIQGGDAVAEGAYLVVAHDRLPAPGPTPGVPLQGAMNLNVFRIGNHLSGNTWELSPETEFSR